MASTTTPQGPKHRGQLKSEPVAITLEGQPALDAAQCIGVPARKADDMIVTQGGDTIRVTNIGNNVPEVAVITPKSARIGSDTVKNAGPTSQRIFDNASNCVQDAAEKKFKATAPAAPWPMPH